MKAVLKERRLRPDSPIRPKRREWEIIERGGREGLFGEGKQYIFLNPEGDKQSGNIIDTSPPSRGEKRGGTNHCGDFLGGDVNLEGYSIRGERRIGQKTEKEATIQRKGKGALSHVSKMLESEEVYLVAEALKGIPLT